MQTTITIAGKDYELRATAATPIRYKAVFGKDFLVEISKLSTDEAVEISEMAAEMAFIMNQSAKKADMAGLKLEDYIAWMEEIDDPMAFIGEDECAAKVIDFYTGTMDGTSTSKKKAEE